jgi:choline monooxygenase
MFDKAEVTHYNFNWKTFIEVYLEDYHVVPFHPGLGGFVDCDSLEWDYGDWYSVQVVGVKNQLKRAGSETYKKWHDMVLQYRNGETPPYGAIWLTIYPNVMVEWYPHVLVVSTILPDGPDKCKNIVEFYYPEEIALFEREFVEAEQKAYAETAIEDEEICQRMNDGRRLLWQEGRDEQGPYQTPYEDGMVHFHEFVRRELSAK